MRRRLVALVLLTCLAGWPRSGAAQEVRVAAASDLQTTLPALAARFEQATGARVRTTFGSSGNFFAQIQNGAPFDVFLSADIDYPRRLEQEGVAEPGTLTAYARGRLVLWTRTDSGVDLRAGLRALLAPSVRRIAIANPEHAPYGRAAVTALMRAAIYEQVRGRFVLGENIAQAAQFAQSGNAQAAIIALSLARGPALRAAGTYVEVPAALHAPIEQGGIVVRAAANKATARQFLAFLRNPATVEYLRSSGFDVPEPAPRDGR